MIDIENVNLRRLELILGRVARGPCSLSRLQEFRGLSDCHTVNGYLEFLSRGGFIEIRTENYRSAGPVKETKIISKTPRGEALLKEVKSLVEFLSLSEKKKDATYQVDLMTHSEVSALIRAKRDLANEIYRNFKREIKLS